LPLVLCDVGPRDGLQNEAEVLEPAVRADLVNRLAAAGLPRVEAVSFVRPDRVPQMAGAEEVVAGIERRDGTEYSGLVLNEQGYERFAAAEGVRRLVVAQDTGGAIKGPVRGDLFWGIGPAAARRAGVMNAGGRYYLLLPRGVAARLAPRG